MNSHGVRKRSLFIVGGGLLATTLAFGSGSAAWAAPTEPQGLDYVALGDSYAAGLGIPSPTGTIPGCGQSDSSYPNLLATELGLDLTDVTCSGATTANIIDTPQSVPGPATNPVQSDALSADTDIVTVTIGGNDLAFTQIIVSCVAGSATGPVLYSGITPKPANCKSIWAPGGVDSLAAAIVGPVSNSLANTLATIHAEAPNAKVFVVGYPALMPDAANSAGGSCFTGAGTNPFPFTDIDVEYLHGVQTLLDQTMNTIATAAGASYVSLLADSLGNTPCANNPNTFINGVLLPSPSSMHPNAAGAAFMAEAAKDAIGSAPTITSTTPPSSGTVGEHFSFTISGTGFPTPQFTVASGALPDGITLDATTGEISGEPTAAGTFSFSILATNVIGSVVSSPYTITVGETAATDPGSSDAPTVPTLVNTGADSLLPIGLAGVLALLAGAGVILTRRRAER